MTQAVALHYDLKQENPTIILAVKSRYRLRLLIQKFENELNKELVELLKEVTNS
jgi:hypothetical protein